MSIFGKILKTGLDLSVGLPVAIVKDVVTMGGAVTAVRRVAKDADEVRREVDKL